MSVSDDDAYRPRAVAVTLFRGLAFRRAALRLAANRSKTSQIYTDNKGGSSGCVRRTFDSPALSSAEISRNARRYCYSRSLSARPFEVKRPINRRSSRSKHASFEGSVSAKRDLWISARTSTTNGMMWWVLGESRLDASRRAQGQHQLLTNKKVPASALPIALLWLAYPRRDAASPGRASPDIPSFTDMLPTHRRDLADPRQSAFRYPISRLFMAHYSP